MVYSSAVVGHDGVRWRVNTGKEVGLLWLAGWKGEEGVWKYESWVGGSWTGPGGRGKKGFIFLSILILDHITRMILIMMTVTRTLTMQGTVRTSGGSFQSMFSVE